MSSFPHSVSVQASAPLDGAGSILSLIALSNGASRASLVEATQLSRVTLTQRVNALLAAGLVREAEATVPSGGRPTRLLTLNPAAGRILSVDLGESHARVAILDLSRSILEQETIPVEIIDGPAATLGLIAAMFERLVAGQSLDAPVVGVAISLPAPVDHRIGRAFGPSILTGWDDFPIGDWLAKRFGVPAIVENDVNLMTVFEHKRAGLSEGQFLFVKAGTGIGSGIMTDGRLYRGAQGAAGDIGHMQLFMNEAPLCRCGKLGCLEARAAGWALARDLRALGFEAQDGRDVIALVERQVPEAVQLLRAAGRALGEALCDTISILNPGRIVIGGTLARAPEHLLAGVYEMIHQRCLPLATRDLVLETSAPVEEACLVGAAHCVVDRIFAPAGVEALLSRYRGFLEAARH